MTTSAEQPTAGRPGTSPRGRHWLREAVRLLVGAAAVVAVALVLREHFDQFERWLDGLGVWAPLVFLAVHAVAVPCFFPVSVLGFVAGASFGFVQGTAVLFVGGLISASIMFALARGLLAGRVKRWAASRPRLQRFMELAEEDSVRLMILMRLSPLHYALVSYLLGASRARFRPYLLTSAFVLPSAALQAYVGHAAREVGRQAVAGEGLATWKTAAMLVAILAAVVLTVILGRMARRALEANVEDA